MNPETMLKMCLGKKRYLTYELADKVARKALAERGEILRIYYCPLCFKFHLTNDAKKIRRNHYETSRVPAAK